MTFGGGDRRGIEPAVVQRGGDQRAIAPGVGEAGQVLGPAHAAAGQEHQSGH